MAQIRIAQSLPRLDEGACLATVVSAQQSAGAKMTLTIDAGFSPRVVPKGVVVLVEFFVGTTGARFEATADGAVVRNQTKADVVATSHVVETSRDQSERIEPSGTIKSGTKEVSVTLGASESQASETQRTTFSGSECLLAITEVGRTGVRWHLRRHRGTKAIADYLEGNLVLNAVAEWNAPERPVITVTAQPTDIRYFGPSGDVLPRRSSIALWLWLRVRGQTVPSRDATVHVVSLAGERDDTWTELPLR